MDRQYGMADFFAMEAGEYLERLDALVSAAEPPGGEDFQRLTRALRGAALMANQQPIAAAAGAFEHLARAFREGRRAWDEGTRQLAIRTVDDLKVFVRHAREWSDADTTRARELAATLERAGGRAVTPPRISASVSPDAGTRAFVAREGAALASGLARAAEAIAHNPAGTDPVQALLRQMQPLRGLATLTEYPPLPDLLDGIERAAALVARSAGTLAAPGELLGSAARALTNATRDITTHGKADPDAVEVRRFATTLRSALGYDRPDVPIEELYADDGAPIVEPGARSHGPRLGEVELTALGEHLKQIGIGIAGAGSGAQRELRILALVEPLRTLEDGVADDLQRQVRAFARACRDAIAGDLVTRGWEPLGHAIQEAGVTIAAGRPEALDRITTKIANLAGGPAGAAPEPAPVIASTAPPAAPPPRPVPAAARATPAPAVTAATAPLAVATEPDAETPDLVGSLVRYQRLVDTLGLGSPSLDEFLAGPPETRAEPAVSPAPVARAMPAAPAAPARVEAEPVPIATLCYTGKRALDRVLSLREQVTQLVAAGAPAGDVQEILEEVFDLVRLGAADVA
jgi:hypothetical protein